MAQIATKEDFSDLKNEIISQLNELKSIVSGAGQSSNEKRWLRSVDVKLMLGISHGKLQKMRDLGQLPFAKIDGVILYNLADVEQILRAK